MAITRRALLLGTAAGCTLAACGGSSGALPRSVPAGATGQLVSGSFGSAAMRGRSVGWSVAYPPGAASDARLPVAIVLHGRGNDHHTVFGSHALQHFLAAAVRGGVPAYALASVDGGDHSYWHRRADGSDAQRMVLEEFVPLLSARGLRTTRLGVAGWSMGGYGALLLAERLAARRCAAVAVDSPALWLAPGDSAPGAFDDRADFVRNDVFAGRPRLHGIPVRIAIGTSDPFYRATRRFAAGLPTPPETDYARGGHDVAFWRRSAPGQLRFLGHALAGA